MTGPLALEERTRNDDCLEEDESSLLFKPSPCRTSTTSHTSFTEATSSSSSNHRIFEASSYTPQHQQRHKSLLNFKLRRAASLRKISSPNSNSNSNNSIVAPLIARALKNASISFVTTCSKQRDIRFYDAAIDLAITSGGKNKMQQQQQQQHTPESTIRVPPPSTHRSNTKNCDGSKQNNYGNNDNNSNSNDNDNDNDMSLGEILGVLASRSKDIIARQQDEIICLRLTVKALILEILNSNLSSKDGGHNGDDILANGNNDKNESPPDMIEIQESSSSSSSSSSSPDDDNNDNDSTGRNCTSDTLTSDGKFSPEADAMATSLLQTQGNASNRQAPTNSTACDSREAESGLLTNSNSNINTNTNGETDAKSAPPANAMHSTIPEHNSVEILQGNRNKNYQRRQRSMPEDEVGYYQTILRSSEIRRRNYNNYSNSNKNNDSNYYVRQRSMPEDEVEYYHGLEEVATTLDTRMQQAATSTSTSTPTPTPKPQDNENDRNLTFTANPGTIRIVGDIPPQPKAIDTEPAEIKTREQEQEQEQPTTRQPPEETKDDNNNNISNDDDDESVYMEITEGSEIVASVLDELIASAMRHHDVEEDDPNDIVAAFSTFSPKRVDDESSTADWQAGIPVEDENQGNGQNDAILNEPRAAASTSIPEKEVIERAVLDVENDLNESNDIAANEEVVAALTPDQKQIERAVPVVEIDKNKSNKVSSNQEIATSTPEKELLIEKQVVNVDNDQHELNHIVPNEKVAPEKELIEKTILGVEHDQHELNAIAPNGEEVAGFSTPDKVDNASTDDRELASPTNVVENPTTQISESATSTNGRNQEIAEVTPEPQPEQLASSQAGEKAMQRVGSNGRPESSIRKRSKDSPGKSVSFKGDEVDFFPRMGAIAYSPGRKRSGLDSSMMRSSPANETPVRLSPRVDSWVKASFLALSSPIAVDSNSGREATAGYRIYGSFTEEKKDDAMLTSLTHGSLGSVSIDCEDTQSGALTKSAFKAANASVTKRWLHPIPVSRNDTPLSSRQKPRKIARQPLDKGDHHPTRPHRPPTRRRPEDFQKPQREEYAIPPDLASMMFLREDEFMLMDPSQYKTPESSSAVSRKLFIYEQDEHEMALHKSDHSARVLARIGSDDSACSLEQYLPDQYSYVDYAAK